MRVTFFERAAVAVGLLVITLAGATGASACFPLPVLSVQPRASGPVGTQVTVEGVDFGVGASEVRWNAIDGPLLGRGSADRFSVPVTIPQAEDGVYAIVAFARQTNDSVGVKAVTPFQVSSGAGAPAARPTSAGPSPVGGSQGSSSSSTRLSASAAVGLALGALAVLVVGGVGGAAVSRRRRRSGS